MYDDSGAHEPVQPVGGQPAHGLVAVRVVSTGATDDRGIPEAVQVILDRVLEQAVDDATTGAASYDVTVTMSLPGAVVLEVRPPAGAVALLHSLAPRLVAGLTRYNLDDPSAPSLRVRVAIDVAPEDDTSAQGAGAFAGLLRLLDPKALQDCEPSTNPPLLVLATDPVVPTIRRYVQEPSEAPWRLIEYQCEIATRGTHLRPTVWRYARRPGTGPEVLELKNKVHLMGPCEVPLAIVAVDIEGYSSRLHLNSERIEMRKVLRELFGASLADAGIEPTSVLSKGDELLVLLPAHTPDEWLIDPVMKGLAERLEDHNARASPEVVIRVRAVVARCWITYDGHDVTGEDLNTAYRLLNSTVLRRRLRTAPGPLALIVPADFYDRLVKHHDAAVAFEQVWILEKETRTPAWISFPRTETGPSEVVTS